MTSPHSSDLELLQALIRRDRQRKLLALLLVSGFTGAAVYAHAVWILAVVATALAAGTACLRRRPLRNQPLDAGTRGSRPQGSTSAPPSLR